MRKVETKLWSWSSYSHMYTFEVPSYSKLLDINLVNNQTNGFNPQLDYLVNNQLVIIFEYDDIISNGTKIFSFYVKDNDLYPSYQHEYFKSIKVSELQRIDTISIGTGFNINLTPPFEKIFYVFFQDQKSLDETRDEKLNDVLSGEFN